MPPITPVPIAFCPPDPAPLEIASGTTPRMNASDVIRIGRNRSCAAATAASRKPFPASKFALANSTIRIAFFADSPIVVSRPTWKYTSLSNPRK